MGLLIDILRDAKQELRGQAAGFVAGASDIIDETQADEITPQFLRSMDMDKMHTIMRLKQTGFYVPGREAIPGEFIKGLFRGRSNIQPADRQAGRGRVMPGRRPPMPPGYGAGYGMGYGVGFEDGMYMGY